MMLGDSVRITGVEGTVAPATFDSPAYVYWTSSVEAPVANVGVIAVNNLRAILPGKLPRELSSSSDVVTWRGDTYTIEGAPMARMRGRRVHHWTVQLRRRAAG